MYNIIQGDCLEEMDKLVSDGVKVDLILTDPPYGTTQCKWDTVIPFEPMWERIWKIAKPNGAVCLFGSEPFSSLLVCSNITCFKEELIWLKNRAPSGMNANKRHMKIHEKILVFSNCENESFVFNPQKWLIPSKEFLTQRKTFIENEYIGNVVYGGNKRTRKPDDGTRFPISLLTCKAPHTTSTSKKYSSKIEIRVHPTQKPIALLEYLIKTYTNEGETVLDFTMGSGSTGVACLNTNRNFIGIELDQKYYNIAKSRLEEAK